MARSTQTRRLVAALLGVGALALMLGTPLADAGKKILNPTKVTATTTKPDAEGRQTVTVTLKIEGPWYAYANPSRNKEVEQAQTTLKLAPTGGGKLEVLKIQYPPGKEHKDDLFGSYWIYEDQATITAQVQRAKGDISPLELTVQYMNCNAKTKQCLMPKTEKLTVK